LVGLLVVMVIILMVSVVVLPTVITSLSERNVINGATLLQGALVGARDAAIASNAPAGIRLLLDPTLSTLTAAGQIDATKSLACNRWVPTSIPPVYTEGTVNTFPGAMPANMIGTVTGNFPYPVPVTNLVPVWNPNYNPLLLQVPCLVVEENPGNWQQDPNSGKWLFIAAAPTSWFWNVRVGEKIRFGVGTEYTVVGPIVVMPGTGGGGNSEMFVNVGPPGAPSPLSHFYTAPDGQTTVPASPEFLLLTNNADDNADGYIDNGWDGINDGNWEVETWLRNQAAGLANQPYAIRRRAVPVATRTVVTLPSSVVIDLTTAGLTQERSRLPVNPWTGSVDLLVNPNGTPWVDLPYGVPTSLGMGAAFYHFWIADRDQVVDMPVPALLTVCQLPCPPAGNHRIVTLAKSGRLTVLEPGTLSFDPTNPSAPFLPIQQGATP